MVVFIFFNFLDVPEFASGQALKDDATEGKITYFLTNVDWAGRNYNDKLQTNLQHIYLY